MMMTGAILTGCGTETVEIPDNDLETVIRHVIEKPEGDIFAWELEEITELKAGRNELYYYKGTTGVIQDLTGLEYCINLEYLDISGNGIRDISPLSSLTRLKILIISDNGITDISPLASLTLLEELNLYNNGITDFGGDSLCRFYFGNIPVGAGDNGNAGLPHGLFGQ